MGARVTFNSIKTIEKKQILK